ncbi:hypothetical protein [Natrinema thermotolerans]
MRDALLVGGCFALALLCAAVASAITESPALLGITPIGIAIYLIVGVGLPQSLLARRTGSALQLGLAALAVAGGAGAVIAGIATGSPNAELSGGVVAILLFVVLGNAIGAVVRQFRDGYRSSTDE